VDDYELNRRCALAIGYEPEKVAYMPPDAPKPAYVQCFMKHSDSGNYHAVTFDPLHDDAQCFALAKAHPDLFEEVVTEWASILRCGERPHFNRMMCERVAKEVP
jgi:hypothetical protein